MGDLTERESLLDRRIVEGYGVMFNQINLSKETFVKGTYAKTIKDNGPGSGSVFEPKFNSGHDSNNPLALFDVLEEREAGLYFRTKPLEEGADGDRVLNKLRSGLLNNFSQEFVPIWEPGKVEFDDKRSVIVFKEVQLMGIAVVGSPSDTKTFAVRSVEDLENLYDETEYFIKQLPRKLQVEARQIFARHKALVPDKPFELLQQQSDTTLVDEQAAAPEPAQGINYNFLTKNFSLK